MSKVAGTPPKNTGTDKTDLQLDANMLGLFSLGPNQLPLENYRIYRGSDPELASKLIGTIAEPRFFELKQPSRQNCIEIRRARLAESQIGIAYNSAPVRLFTPKPITHYSICIPLSGTATYTTERGIFTLRAPEAFFLSANEVLDIERSENHAAIILALKTGGFETLIGGELELLAMPEKPYSLIFEPREPRFETFCSILGALIKVLNESGDSANQDLIITRLEQALWYKFFAACPDVLQLHQANQKTYGAPASVQRVVKYIETHAEDEITMEQLVSVANASLRSLHEGFRANYQCGPMAFVRKTKLNRCRKRLLDADPSNISVTDIASEWGFFHMSYFAKIYREEFGELPSETLNKPAPSIDQSIHHSNP